MNITDDMRKAVYAADCENEGHILNIDNMMSNDPDAPPSKYLPTIRSTNPDTLPHIVCRRCDAVWIVIPDPGHGYAAAETQLIDRLPLDDKLNEWVIARNTEDN